jgi:Acetyltransferase (GNAT) domain
MKVKKYGITLRRLTKDDIELVRQHRNSDFIRSKMFYQEIISAEEQKKWFASINNDWNYYFLIDYKGKTVGMVHGTIESYEERTARGGIFIWDKASLNSSLPMIASICANDLTLFILGIKRITVEVRSDNTIALNHNKSIGYTVLEQIETDGKIIMELTKGNYIQSSKKIKEMIKKITKDSTDLSWDDVEMPASLPEGLYQDLPQYLNEKLKLVYQKT